MLCSGEEFGETAVWITCKSDDRLEKFVAVSEKGRKRNVSSMPGVLLKKEAELREESANL